MARLTPAQKIARRNARKASPFALARVANVQGVALDANPNRAKHGASPLNWNARTIAHDTIKQPASALRVSHPLRTPTGRIARTGGQPAYSSYTIGSRMPQPVEKGEK